MSTKTKPAKVKAKGSRGPCTSPTCSREGTDPRGVAPAQGHTGSDTEPGRDLDPQLPGQCFLGETLGGRQAGAEFTPGAVPLPAAQRARSAQTPGGLAKVTGLTATDHTCLGLQSTWRSQILVARGLSEALRASPQLQAPPGEQEAEGGSLSLSVPPPASRAQSVGNGAQLPNLTALGSKFLRLFGTLSASGPRGRLANALPSGPGEPPSPQACCLSAKRGPYMLLPCLEGQGSIVGTGPSALGLPEVPT